MKFPHLSLLNYIVHLPHDAEIILCSEGRDHTTSEIPETLAQMIVKSDSGARYLAGRRVLALGEHPRQAGQVFRVALLVSLGAEKDTQLLMRLLEYGCEEICFYDASHGRWCVLPFRSRTEFWIRWFMAVLRSNIKRFHGNGWVLLKKLILKMYAKDLRDTGSALYTHEIGNCYLAEVPTLRPFASSTSPLMLFEESAMLQGGCSHEEIRTHGHGRFSHWNDHIYFSSTDNSDPNGNARRYRWVSGSSKVAPILKWLCSDGSLPDSTISSSVSDSSAKFLKSPPANYDRLVEIQYTASSPGENEVGGEAANGVGLFISSLGAGGAERQLCYVARALKEMGVRVSIFIPSQSEDDGLHYLDLLQSSGIEVYFVSSPHPSFNVSTLLTPSGIQILAIIEHLPDYLKAHVWNLYTHLLIVRPRVLHCWLDQPNIQGGLAGLIAGIPKIILSTRNLNPSHFPYIYFEWYQQWYQYLLRSPRVSLSGNSLAGVQSYAHWLRYPVKKCTVVHNGLDDQIIVRPSHADVQRFRESLGIEPSDPLVVGVLRLSPEKRPLRFLRVISELRLTFPRLRAILVGMGSMQSEVKEEIENRGLAGTVTLLGRRQDIPLIVGSSDLFLLTSLHEGFPNVLMEAQWLGVPVVATDAGGCSEVVRSGVTGYVCKRDDFGELVERCRDLLADDSKRLMFGRAGREWIRENFMLKTMVEKTVALYALSSQDFHAPGNDSAALVDKYVTQASGM